MTLRILVGYRYGILGGVCTQLINRLRPFSAHGEVEAHLLFAHDYGISTTLAGYPHVHFECNPAKVKALAADGEFDAAVVIDTPEFLQALQGFHRLPLITEVHTTVEQGLAYLRQRDWRTDGYIVPSDYSRRLLRERFQVPEIETIDVVPNCLDMGRFPRIDLERVPRRPVHAWVGKLDDHKNWRGFLAVAAGIARRRPDSEFWLVGGYTAPMDAEQALVDEMARLGLSDRCRWLPRVEYGAMHKLYAAVRQSGGTVVVTSINESFGMSVLEALVCGCPVIASDVGAIPEIAPDRPYLRLYARGDYARAAVLADELVDSDPGARVREALAADRAWLEERFSTDTVSARYVRTLRGIIESAPMHAARSRVAEPVRSEAASGPPAGSAAGSAEVVRSPSFLAAIAELRSRIPGGDGLGPEPESVVRAASRLLGGRSYRVARLVAGRGGGARGLARLPLRLWRELRKSP